MHQDHRIQLYSRGGDHGIHLHVFIGLAGIATLRAIEQGGDSAVNREMGGIVDASADHKVRRLLRFSLNLPVDLPDNGGIFGNQILGRRRCETVVPRDLIRGINLRLFDHLAQQFRGLGDLYRDGMAARTAYWFCQVSDKLESGWLTDMLWLS